MPEWLKERYAWHIQMFNIANYTLATHGGVGGGARSILDAQPVGSSNGELALAGVAACASSSSRSTTRCSRRCSRSPAATRSRESGLFTFESLSTDLVLASLGVGVAALWHCNPWLIPFALAPLVLDPPLAVGAGARRRRRASTRRPASSTRATSRPTLREELARAARFERPMSLIMADLDLLRDINNTYGHLAGDAVLAGVAEVFREQLRDYDVPARFGGEEFSILLPETPPEEALEIAERIRRAVADSEFEVETSSEPIRATVSIGVAGFPRDGATRTS